MRFVQELQEYGIEELSVRDILLGITLDQLTEKIVEAHADSRGDDVEDLGEVVSETYMQFMALPFKQKIKHIHDTCQPQAVNIVGIPSDEIVEVWPGTVWQPRMFYVRKWLP